MDIQRTTRPLPPLSTSRSVLRGGREISFSTRREELEGAQRTRVVALVRSVDFLPTPFP